MCHVYLFFPPMNIKTCSYCNYSPTVSLLSSLLYVCA
uniref:Uncharacterized protein n=1 Tax=Anguilla anguilla TaxID=7936 RepID=A0A0E9XBT1_ANGAN